jgi:NitT/TauT family transport system substrate-binding protein
MAHINIEFTLFSAFYSPLISLMSGGFLRAEGLEADWTVSPPGVSAVKALEEGRADVIQSVQARPSHPSRREKRRRPFISHRSTRWTGSSSPAGLPIRTLIGSGSKGQRSFSSAAANPWLCSNTPATRPASILPSSRSSALVVPRKWIRRFGKAKGNTFSSKGPSRSSSRPMELGTSSRNAARRSDLSLFSSLAATRDWLQSDVAKAFMRAYTKTRAYMLATPAIEIAKAEKSFFPTIGLDVVAQCISSYQQLGCWTSHVEITRPAFEVALDVFAHFGSLKERYGYDQVCAPPPSEG